MSHAPVAVLIFREVTFLSFYEYCVLPPLGYDSKLARCVEKDVGAARRDDASVGYPACLYTRAQLERMTKLAEPWLSNLNYSLPDACQPVLQGTSSGGTDAVPLSV